MVWFWKKKPATATDGTATATAGGSDAMAAQAAVAAQAEAAVQAAVEDAQRSDKEWRRQAARLRDQEKRLEKERARAAKRELALMKKQARAARRERRQAEKRAQKQAKAVLKVHLREQKAERKRVKTLAKLRRRREKRDKKLLRRRQKEERRRRRRARAEDQARVAAAAAVDAESQPVEPQAAMAGVPLGVAPSFKEDARCKSCSSQFQRLPTRRRHHCRNCGESFCSKCLSRVKRPIPWFKLDKPQKVCFSCDVQVFNGMGGTARPARSASSDTTAPSTPPAPVTPGVEFIEGVQQVEETSYRRSPLLAQRSASFQSEQPEDSPRTASPPGSRNGLSFRLRPRSRRDASSSKSKKGGSLWTLPIRPLLKRKASADQLRNRSWDLDLRIEKEEMLARQRQALMVVPTRAPQFATAS